MRVWPSSLRLRLTLWYGILLGLPLVVFAIVCYIIFARALLNRTDLFVGDALGAFSRELVAERRATATLDQAMRTTATEVASPICTSRFSIRRMPWPREATAAPTIVVPRRRSHRGFSPRCGRRRRDANGRDHR